MEGKAVLREIHSGSCGAHPAASSLALIALRQGYYWPSMKEDAANLVKNCAGCQYHGTIPKQPAEEYHSVTSPWPFAQWGMDIVGPLPTAIGGKKFLIVAVDYFTKWVEAQPVTTTTARVIKAFVLENILARFGVPRVLVTDNGTQFASEAFTTWCREMGIKQKFASVAHPQANGQTEVTNRILLAGIKARIGDSRKEWMANLPNILWAYRTTPRSSTGETPYSLCYGVEAVVPVEIFQPTFRTERFDEEHNEEGLRGHLDLVEEARERAQILNAHYRARVAKHYNKHVKPRSFDVGDFVVRKAEASKPASMGKLAPNWEGPYRVKEVGAGGAYKLEEQDGTPVPRTWHVGNLKRFYY